MNTDSRWLANRTILAIDAEGKKREVTLRIGTPYQVSPEEWACPAAMDGFHERLHDIHGTDAWQAIQLVQSLQAQLLSYFVQEGGRLLCHEPPESIEIQDLFPKVPLLPK